MAGQILRAILLDNYCFCELSHSKNKVFPICSLLPGKIHDSLIVYSSFGTFSDGKWLLSFKYLNINLKYNCTIFCFTYYKTYTSSIKPFVTILLNKNYDPSVSAYLMRSKGYAIVDHKVMN